MRAGRKKMSLTKKLLGHGAEAVGRSLGKLFPNVTGSPSSCFLLFFQAEELPAWETARAKGQLPTG